MSEFVIRACCDFAPAGKVFVDEASDGLAAINHGPAVAPTTPPEPEWAAALHESGHAVFSHYAGRRLRSISVVPAQCRFASGTVDEVAHVALAYAGAVGEMTELRHYVPMRPEDET